MRVAGWICVILCTSLVSAFNLEPRIAIIKQGAPKTFFGFSVAQHQTFGRQNTSWVLVGAPIANSLQPNISFSGALYRCPLTTLTTDCQQVVTEELRDTISTLPDNHDGHLYPPLPTEEKTGQWLGVVVYSQGPGRKVLLCAHRFANRGTYDEYYHMIGSCYTLNQKLEVSDSFQPCSGLNKKGGYTRFGMCQAGTSGIISDDDLLLLGMPGSVKLEGTVYAVNISDNYLLRDKTIFYGPNSPSASPVEEGSFNGMAVAYGKFLSPHGPHSLVSGAHRAGLTGQVIFYSIVREARWSKSTLAVEMILEGEMDFSNFGYSLCTLDLNSDGMTDLVVGAPHHYTAGTGGAIYIYTTPRSGLKADTPYTRILGLPDSQFGIGLSTAGDLNQDGFEDLVVGAPFEEGGGTVYIYSGSREGIANNQQASQVIRARDVSGVSGLMAFGYSVSGGQDLDGNNYPDLAVGAFCSDHVLLIRSRPIISMETKLQYAEGLNEIDVSQIECIHNPSSRQKCVGFESCFWLKSPRTSIPNAYIEYRLEAETFDSSRKFSRVYFSQSSKNRTHVVIKDIEITSQMTERFFCRKEYMYIKNSIVDIHSPIRFQISYRLLLPNPEQRPGLPLPDINKFPILDQHQATKKFEAHFAKDCGSDRICQSGFLLNAVYDLPLDSDGMRAFDAGSSRQLSINISVASEREPAYDAKLRIKHPEDIGFVGTRAQKGLTCTSGADNSIVCALGNPFHRGLRELVLKFDVSSLARGYQRSLSPVYDNQATYDDWFLDFELSVTTSSQLDETVEKRIRARVIQRSDIEISGVAKPEQTTYGNEETGAYDDIDVQYIDQVGSPILHTYDIYNNGPLTAEWVDVFISWPYRLATGRDEVDDWLMYLTRTPFVQGDGSCFVEDTHINPLRLKSRQNEPDLVVRVKSDTEKLNVQTSRISSTSSVNYSSGGSTSSNTGRLVTGSALNSEQVPPRKTYTQTRKNSIEDRNRKVSTFTQESSSTYRRKHTSRGRFRDQVSTIHRGSSGVRHGVASEGFSGGSNRRGGGDESLHRHTPSSSGTSTPGYHRFSSTDSEEEDSFTGVSSASSSSDASFSSSFSQSSSSSSSDGGVNYRRFNAADDPEEDRPPKSRRLYTWQRPRHKDYQSAIEKLRERRRKHRVRQNYESRDRTEETLSSSSDLDRSSRRRRSEPRTAEPETIQDDTGQSHTIVKIDCESGTALCLRIRCRINRLPAKNYALIHLQGRLSNSSLLHHFPHVSWVSVSSSASYSLPPGVRSKDPRSHQVETRAYSQLGEGPGTVPVWAIVLAVLLGLLLLALLVLLLWKLGFFQRRKPTQ